MAMCYKCLKDFQQEEKKRDRPSKITSESDFVQLMSTLEAQRTRGFETHPKMRMVQEIVNDHFLKQSRSGESAEPHELDQDSPMSGKIMVFIQYRDCVDEVVALLNRQQPVINASRFIGQGTDKQGRKGINQSEQIEVRNLT